MSVIDFVVNVIRDRGRARLDAEAVSSGVAFMSA